MDGIKRCEMFRAIRKRICENNGIPFLEEGCPTPNKWCIGTCPECDHWLERINAHLELKHQNGEEIDYNGIKEIYDSFMEDNIISIEIEEDNKHAHTHFGPLMGDIDVKE